MAGDQGMSGLLPLMVDLYLTRNRPVSLVHFITHRCNARCPFCFIDFDDPATFRNELTVDEIDTFTRTLGPCLQNVNLTGGEPFARKEIVDIARCYYRNTPIRSLFITSNGSLPDRIEAFIRTLNPEFPDRMVIFSFSIDGLGEEHDRIRRIDGLFDKTLRSYHMVRRLGPFAQANIGITVSPENHARIPALYETLIETHGVRAITAGLVRDEGVFKVPEELRRAMLDSYTALTAAIRRDLQSGRLEGYDTSTIQGRLMNKKNMMVYDIVRKTYDHPHYISPCPAGALFGIIAADGMVHPCEILDRPLGNLRDHGLDFMKVWDSATTAETRRFIKDSHCHCTYECAWSFNILSNYRYQPDLLMAALGRFW
jgi:MoaA/NifB/PqqE/SkfB family radical SAM enzyme